MKCIHKILFTYTYENQHSYSTDFTLFSEYIGYNPFTNRNKLTRWYDAVREELGPYYKEISAEFENKLRMAEKGHKEAVSLKQ